MVSHTINIFSHWHCSDRSELSTGKEKKLMRPENTGWSPVPVVLHSMAWEIDLGRKEESKYEMNINKYNNTTKMMIVVQT